MNIGTRGSKLALWQANYVRSVLEKKGIETEILIIKTQGDIIQNISFDKMEGKGFFTKEIEHALLTSQIDLAVHSYKDLETTQPVGLEIVATPPRAAVEDVLLIREECFEEGKLMGVAPNAIIGTSSNRRAQQLLGHLPDLNIKALRGNVPTRVEKLRSGEFDAIMIAKAGLDRLEMDISDLHHKVLDVDLIVPAAAQGALAIQMRQGEVTEAIKSALNHAFSEELVTIERKVLASINGGCQVPFGAHCSKTDETYWLNLFQIKEEEPTWAHLSADDGTSLLEMALDYLKQ